ncbi:MAG: methylenetetrahydrofolate reductase, partial [Candidatus Latescibacterota bacterium]|nr:methylenetetrahydrofolate reductase [Candidatus Latescibacterota bacterium]
PPTVADRLRRGLFVVTAEQAHSAQAPGYRRLVRRGVVDAVTLPDIPLVGRVGEIVRILSRREAAADIFAQLPETAEPVFTISSSTRTRAEVERRILRAAEQGVAALLALSGGDLIRRALGTVPGGQRLLPMNAFSTLALVRQLREQGRLPPDLPVWAVENPLIGRVSARVDRLAKKIDGGAEAILLQPPLLWDRFTEWWSEVDRRGLNRDAPLVVGVPVITSVAMLRFWLVLVGLKGSHPQARPDLQGFAEAERTLDDEGFVEFKRAWSAELIGKLRQLPGIGGIHLMPISGTGDIQDILGRAGIGAADRARWDVDILIDALRKRSVGVVHEPGLRDDGYAHTFRQALRTLEQVLESRPQAGGFQTYWNRITYAQHFRMPVALRSFLESDGRERAWEIAVDLRQHGTGLALRDTLTETLERRDRGVSGSEDGVAIGDWVPYSASPVWQFNDAFWRHVSDFIAAHGRDYRDSIGGSPDSDVELVRAHATLFLDQLANVRRQDPETDFVYLEIGVASVDYARSFIDTLTVLARSRQLDLGALTYALADAAPGVLDSARAELGNKRHGVRLEYLLANVENPLTALTALSGRILRTHMTSVVDNLPNDKLAQIDGDCFLIETRLYLPRSNFDDLCQRYELDPGWLERALRAIPEGGALAFVDDLRTQFSSYDRADFQLYHFWQDLYGNPEDSSTGLKMEERYVRIEELGSFAFLDVARTGGLTVDPAQVLREVLDEYPRNVWMHLSNRAIEGCLQLISLLHPHGALEIIDVIVRRISDYHQVPQRLSRKGRPLYRMGFKGPAKYDGSAVDWFNGRLFEAAARHCFPEVEVRYQSLEDFGRPHMSRMELYRTSSMIR